MARSNVATAIRIALCGLTAPALAVAQEQPAPGSSEPAVQDETEEVVVQAKRYRPKDQTTATGLRLDLIDTPQSISVISEEMMDLAGVRSAYEAAEMVPGVNRQGTGFGSEFLIIRGQDAGDPRINGIDAYSASYLDAYATERLEIVRGPATVLYGVTASFGGEVNQVLKSPSANFSGNIGIEAGDFDRQRFEADVTGAIPGTDGRLKVRAAGAYTDAGMYQDLVQPTNNIDKLALLAATYDFTDSTSFTVHAYRQERDLDAFDGCTLVEDENNVLSIPRSIPFDRFYCNDPRQSQALVENNFAIASLSHQFANDWRIEAKVAKSSTDRNLNYVYGFGPAGADIEGSLYLSEGEIYFLSYAELTEDESFTSNLSLGGEFELAGRTHEFLAALEYQSSDLKTTNYLSTSLGYLDLFEDGGKGVLTDGSPIPPLPLPELAGVQDSDVEQLRGSVQILLNPTDRLQVLAGALIQRSEQVDRNDLVDDDDTRAELTQTDTVGRLGLTYRLLEDGPGQPVRRQCVLQLLGGHRTERRHLRRGRPRAHRPAGHDLARDRAEDRMVRGRLGLCTRGLRRRTDQRPEHDLRRDRRKRHVFQRAGRKTRVPRRGAGTGRRDRDRMERRARLCAHGDQDFLPAHPGAARNRERAQGPGEPLHLV